jgi:hypothetical protein
MSDVCVTRMLSTEWRSMGGVQTPNNGDSKQIHLKVSSFLFFSFNLMSIPGPELHIAECKLFKNKNKTFLER